MCVYIQYILMFFSFSAMLSVLTTVIFDMQMIASAFKRSKGLIDGLFCFWYLGFVQVLSLV